MNHATRLAMPFLALIIASTSASAAPSPEAKCQKGRSYALAIYLSCHQKALGKFYEGTSDGAKLQSSLAKCLLTFQKVNFKLMGYSGTTCAASRFVENADGTVSDNWTGLDWAQKDELGGVHDKNSTFTWSVGVPWTESGDLFGSYLSTVNNSALGGSRGWRIPSLQELQTLLIQPYPCSLCWSFIGPTPVTPGVAFWSSTPVRATYLVPQLSSVWSVDIASGAVVNTGKDSSGYALAVRGGF